MEGSTWSGGGGVEKSDKKVKSHRGKNFVRSAVV